MNNNHNNTTTNKSFVDSFKSISKNLAIRYTINMHLDFIQEFIKFADNTRDIELLDNILSEISCAESAIINLIQNYEDENKHSENID